MRYAKQIQVMEFGEQGQAALQRATVAVVGCGALGCLLADLLTRMGVGHLRIADNDMVTLGNIHRQLLFTEKDAERGVPKVEAAARRLAQVNREVRLTTFNQRVTEGNIGAFTQGADIVLDATDDTPTRFMINRHCVRTGLPWVYTGVAGAQGQALAIVPGAGPCLHCLYPEEPTQNDSANGLTSGILPPVVTFAASLQLTQALRVLTGTSEQGRLMRFDIWDAAMRATTVPRNPACPCCGTPPAT